MPVISVNAYSTGCCATQCVVVSHTCPYDFCESRVPVASMTSRRDVCFSSVHNALGLSCVVIHRSSRCARPHSMTNRMSSPNKHARVMEVRAAATTDSQVSLARAVMSVPDNRLLRWGPKASDLLCVMEPLHWGLRPATFRPQVKLHWDPRPVT